MIPCPRLYHSSGICEKGNAKDILIVFGGRDQKEQALNDIWGLRKHRNGKWDWIKAPINNNFLKFTNKSISLPLNLYID